MRTRGLGAGRCTARFQHHDRLFLRHAPCDFRKGAAVFQVLAMLRDDLGVVVLLEERQQIVLIDVGFVAETDDRRDAHLGRARKADDRHADAAGLRRQGRGALDVVSGAERRAQIGRGIIEAVDVRSHQANTVFLADRLDFLLALDVAGFGVARRNQDRSDDFLLAALDQRRRHEARRNGEHGNIDVAGNILDRLVDLLAHDLIGLRMDRVDLALVAAIDEIFHHGVADLAVLGGRPDHRNRLRLHDPVHLAHDVVMFRTRARRLAGSLPRTPLSISWAWMPSSIDSASCLVAGASRKVMSLRTSTSTPPRPKATSLPNDPSVTAPTMTSCPPSSICWTWMPSILASDLYFLAFARMVA